MTDVSPRLPTRPLVWPDLVLDLQDVLIASVKVPVYIVGGAVRDAWQHKPLKDLDLATPGNATKLARRIADFMDGDIFVMDAERDVARVFLDLQPGGPFIIDVAHFRGDTLLDDLTDRDFTLNAIAVDLLGDLNHIIDPLNGERDLSNKVIRHCADHAISRDPLRALRAIRQSTQLDARIEPETLKAIRAASLSTVSSERIRDEWFKLLDTSAPSKPLRIVGALGLMDDIIPEITVMKAATTDVSGVNTQWDLALRTVEKMNGVLNTISTKRTDTTAARFELGMIVMALDRYRRELQAHIGETWPNQRPHTTLLIFAALMIPLEDGATAGERAAALRLSNDEKKRITRMVDTVERIFALPQKLTDLHMHRFWFPLHESGIDAILLSLAAYLARHTVDLKQDEWIIILDQVGALLDAYFNRHEQVVDPPPLIDGNYLIDVLGTKPGKHIGRMLVTIREGQVTGEITTEEDAIEAARALLDD